MGHQTIRHTIKRNGVYYVRFRLPDNKFFRKSLETDSHTQAQLLMSFASPVFHWFNVEPSNRITSVSVFLSMAIA